MIASSLAQPSGHSASVCDERLTVLTMVLTPRVTDPTTLANTYSLTACVEALTTSVTYAADTAALMSRGAWSVRV